MNSTRLYGIDLARVFAMFLVVLFHSVGIFSGFDSSCTAGRILRAATICCVDFFALISGYVGIKSKFRPSRFAALWVQTVFTGIIVVGVGTALGMLHPSLKDWGKVFAPISSYAYWYLTAYFLLFLLSPFLNAGLIALSKHTIALVMVALGFFVICVPALNPCHSDTYVLSHGLSGIWLIVCYIMGGGMRRLDNGRGSALAWLLVSIFLIALNCFWSGGYSHPAVLVLAMSYLMMCTRVKISSPRLQKHLVFFSSYAFGVYLWHVQPLLHAKLFGCLHFVCNWQWYVVVPTLIIFSVLLYLIISILETGRMWLFRKLSVESAIRKIDTISEGGRI